MWWSVELTESGSIYIQPTEFRRKHGAKGKVLIPACLYHIADAIKNENNV